MASCTQQFLIVSKSKTYPAWIKLLKCLSGIVYESALFIFREKANTLMSSIFHKSVPCCNSKLCVFVRRYFWLYLGKKSCLRMLVNIWVVVADSPKKDLYWLKGLLIFSLRKEVTKGAVRVSSSVAAL